MARPDFFSSQWLNWGHIDGSWLPRQYFDMARERSHPSRRLASRKQDRGGVAFSLIELLVVIAVIGVLAALLLPALNRGKLKAQGLYCMSNHRQLSLAWKMYSDDSRDYLPYASELPWYPETRRYAWVSGTLDFDPDNRSNWDPRVDIHQSPLWPYCGQNLSIWKCPADRSGVTVNGDFKPRVRSMSMNIFLGGWAGTAGGWGRIFSDYIIYMKQSELANPGPSKIFVFLDLREDSIDMGNFATDMRGWPDQPQRNGFFDLPASYHGQAAGFSFADGHAEIKAWQDERTMPPLVIGGGVRDHFSAPDNADVQWLQARASRPRKVSPPVLQKR
jgi:prepilin-type N-terminal cleavage/methylation domain-containing protein/prepilin-type processing-associated H-X9-DG protein